MEKTITATELSMKDASRASESSRESSAHLAAISALLCCFCLSTAAAAQPAAAPSARAPARALQDMALAAQLAGRWRLSLEPDVSLETSYAGWPLGAFCASALPTATSQRLRDELSSLSRGLVAWHPPAHHQLHVTVEVQGYADATDVRPHTSILMTYRCGQQAQAQALNGDDAKQATGFAKGEAIQVRLARFRALTAKRLFLQHWPSGKASPGASASAATLDGISVTGTWERRRAGAGIRHVTIKVHLKLVAEPSLERLSPPLVVSGSDRRGELLRVDSEKPAARHIGLGITAGLFSPLQPQPLAVDFGTNAAVYIALRIEPRRLRWLSIGVNGFVGWRPDGLIELNGLLEHYSTAIVALGGNVLARLKAWRFWLGAGPELDLLYVRRNLIFNSSQQTQESAAGFLGVAGEAGLKLFGPLDLWLSSRLGSLLIDVKDGASHPLSLQVGLGFLYWL